MRTLLALLVLLATPALADHGRCGPRYARHHGHHGCRTYVRHYPHHHDGYRSCYYPRHHYGYYGYVPHIRLAGVYTRLGASWTLDDPVFHGAAGEADGDGLPRPRSEPVGRRFLVDSTG